MTPTLRVREIRTWDGDLYKDGITGQGRGQGRGIIVTYSLFTQDSAVSGPEVETGTRSADNRNNNMYGESFRHTDLSRSSQYRNIGRL